MIYILTHNDLVTYGYGTKSAKVFTKLEDAKTEMVDAYLEKCKEEMIDTPLATDSYDYQLTDNYAFIEGKYYWDIFTQE